MPLFSVIIPTYNRSEKLLRCIESVKGNQFADCEIIVVDDGSQDDTEAKVRKYHPDVTYIKQANGGVSSARNHGMRAAKGRYFAFLDSDDLWYPNRLATVDNAWKMLPGDVGLVFNDMDLIGRDCIQGMPSARGYFGINFELFLKRVEGSREIHLEGKDYYLKFGDLFECLLGGNFVPPSCAVIRREVYEDLGGFREDFTVAEDSDYFLRIARRYKIGFIPLVLTSVELPESSISLSRPAHNVVKVNNAILTVTQLENDEEDHGIRRKLKLRMAKLYSLAAYHYLSELNRRDARRLSIRSIDIAPFLLEGYLIFALARLPVSFLSMMAALKRRMRGRNR